MSQSRLCIVPSEAVSDARLTHVQLRVLLAIGSFTGKDKAAFPKQQTIADMLGLARETVNRAIGALKRFGYIEVEAQKRPDGGQKESLYWVKLDPLGQPPCDATVTPPVTLSDHTPCDVQESHPRTFHKNDTTEQECSVVDARDAPPPESPEPKKSSGRVRGIARKTQIPPNWAPGITAYAFASKSGLSREEINHEADQFRNSAAASGRTYADWDAAFRTWLGNTVKWRAERAARSPAGPKPGGQSRGGGMVAAGLRAIRETRGYGEPLPDPVQGRSGNDDMGAGYDLDGDALRIAGGGQG